MEQNKSPSSSTATRMLYGIEDRPPLKQAIPLALQNVFAMFGATILVPIIVNGLAGAEVLPIPVAICMSGVGTLVYQKCTKNKSPMYLGSSFAFISPIALAYDMSGIAGAMTGLAVVGLIYVLFALIVKIAGTGWLHRLLPPIVIGPMIMVIGLGLAPSAISQIGLDNTETDVRNLIVALITVAAVIFFMIFAKGFFKVIPFLMAIVVGYIASLILGIADLTPVAEAGWFSIPRFQIMGYHYLPVFDAVLQMAPIALVTMAEHIGDHEAQSTITGRDLLENPGLFLTLLGDGLATLIAALFGAPANTSYGENIAVSGITKCSSVYVLKMAAIFAIAMSFAGKLTALIAAIPSPVLGGVSMILYGFIALSGAKVWVKNRINFEYSRNIIVTSVMLVLGLGGAVLAIKLGNISITFSGMSLAALFGILLSRIPMSKEEQDEIHAQQLDDRRLEILHNNPDLLAEVDALMPQ